ncbi:MAG: hypothetical protein FWF14_05145 [Streptococcaceae bacterium]|nr:hypothetical protein [Streptococcaceae bacterium]
MLAILMCVCVTPADIISSGWVDDKTFAITADEYKSTARLDYFETYFEIVVIFNVDYFTDIEEFKEYFLPFIEALVSAYEETLSAYEGSDFSSINKVDTVAIFSISTEIWVGKWTNDGQIEYIKSSLV